VHELCCVQNSVRAYLRQNLKAFTPARAAGEKKAKGGVGCYESCAACSAVRALTCSSEQHSRRLSSALKRCNDVGGRLRDAGEPFNKKEKGGMLAHKAVLRAAQWATHLHQTICACAKRVSSEQKGGRVL